jgi:hypothetical protein
MSSFDLKENCNSSSQQAGKNFFFLRRKLGSFGK